MNPCIVIPARMAATRLPGKPMAEINGKPMILHVWEKAVKAKIGPVIVACCDHEVQDIIKRKGGIAVMTNPDLPSGTDRVQEAIDLHDLSRSYDIVINLQGDLPTINPENIRLVLDPLKEHRADISSLVSVIKSKKELNDQSVVKCAASIDENTRIGRALYFSRNPIPSGDGEHYHHQGIYAFTRIALTRFVQFKPTILEQREKLEQLRALENDMRIDVAVVDECAMGVDTPKDLENIRKIVE